MLQWRYVLETLKMVSRKYCKVAKKNVAILILIPHSPFPLHSSHNRLDPHVDSSATAIPLSTRLRPREISIELANPPC